MSVIKGWCIRIALAFFKTKHGGKLYYFVVKGAWMSFRFRWWQFLATTARLVMPPAMHPVIYDWHRNKLLAQIYKLNRSLIEHRKSAPE